MNNDKTFVIVAFVIIFIINMLIMVSYNNMSFEECSTNALGKVLSQTGYALSQEKSLTFKINNSHSVTTSNYECEVIRMTNKLEAEPVIAIFFGILISLIIVFFVTVVRDYYKS